MHDPAERAEADEPEDSGADKKQKRRKKAALHELPEPGEEKAGQRRNYITRRALACRHGTNKSRGRTLVDSADVPQLPRKRSNMDVVDRPGTRGRMRTSAPAEERAARSSASSDSGV